MKKRKKRGILPLLTLLGVGILILACFLGALDSLKQGELELSREQLEQAVRRAAVSCYATRGSYPDTLEDLVEDSGLLVDEERFIIHYEAFARNLMPDITVMER